VTILAWYDTLRGTKQNLSNKVYNIKTGRLELAKGFTVLFTDPSNVEGWKVKVIL